MSISVITASLPTRAGMLGECMASVAAQTLLPFEHLIAVDHARRGSSATRNALLAGVVSEWVAVIDDDDLMLPEHLATLARGDADVVYTYSVVRGRENVNFNEPFDADELRERNFIPMTALIRTALLRDLGGWRDSISCPGGFEDWDLWRRALDAGATFACIPEVTWVYRFHGGNKTDRGEVGAS